MASDSARQSFALLTDISQHVGVATSMCGLVPTGLFTTFLHARSGRLRLSASALVVGTAMVSAAVCSFTIAPSVSDDILRRLFGVMLAAGAVQMAANATRLLRSMPRP